MTTIQASHPRVIRSALEGLNLKQLQALADLSGVPFQTLYKIRNGQTPNPRTGTVHAFAPHVGAALAQPKKMRGKAHAS